MERLIEITLYARGLLYIVTYKTIHGTTLECNSRYVIIIFVNREILKK